MTLLCSIWRLKQTLEIIAEVAWKQGILGLRQWQNSYKQVSTEQVCSAWIQAVPIIIDCCEVCQYIVIHNIHVYNSS